MMNKMLAWGSLSFGVVLLVGYLYQTVPNDSERYTVQMISNKGEDMENIRLSETHAGILLELNMTGLMAGGVHAIHIHETGDCSPTDDFKNAGGHFNPGGQNHGLKHDEGHHAGDMPNIAPDEAGASRAMLLNKKLTLNKEGDYDGRYTVFDKDGSAIVIHEAADDHISQPSGAAEPRLACGVIKL